MLHKRTSFKKTKKGNVLRVTREHYLRDDIGCGSEACSECNQPEDRISLPKLVTVEKDKKFYPIIHTSLLLHQIDLLENPVVIF